MEKSIAEKHVGTPEAKTWKSRVNATIRRVHSRFGGLHLAVPLTWTLEKRMAAEV
jgi:hypothetical protein